jgi:Ca2+-binding EF-hand superfamily protein
MTRSRLLAAGCAVLILASAVLQAQPPDGRSRGFGGYDSMRSRGGDRDPNEFFNRLSNGKDVINRADMDPRFQFMFDRMAQSLGLTNPTQLTRDQFRAASEAARSRMGGSWGGGPQGGSGTTITTITPSGPGSPGGGPGGDSDRSAEERFRRYDRNGDGVLQYDEMSDSLKAVWTNYDANKNGVIELDEYKAYMRDRQQQRQGGSSGSPQSPNGQTAPAGVDGLPPPISSAPAEEEDRRPVVYRVGKLPKQLPAWFEQMDTDKDGQIGLYEWVKAGRTPSDFQTIDRNDDGFLTVEEVLTYVRNTKPGDSDTAVASMGGDGRPGGPGGMFGRGGPGGGFERRGTPDGMNGGPGRMMMGGPGSFGGPGGGFGGFGPRNWGEGRGGPGMGRGQRGEGDGPGMGGGRGERGGRGGGGRDRGGNDRTGGRETRDRPQQ